MLYPHVCAGDVEWNLFMICFSDISAFCPLPHEHVANKLYHNEGHFIQEWIVCSTPSDFTGKKTHLKKKKPNKF